jgi:hypothetical protein
LVRAQEQRNRPEEIRHPEFSTAGRSGLQVLQAEFGGDDVGFVEPNRSGKDLPHPSFGSSGYRLRASRWDAAKPGVKQVSGAQHGITDQFVANEPQGLPSPRGRFGGSSDGGPDRHFRLTARDQNAERNRVDLGFRRFGA